MYRRFSDFVWLSRRLRACRPWRGTKSTPMPPPLPKLPPKTFAGRKTHAIFLHERQALLADFLVSECASECTEPPGPHAPRPHRSHLLTPPAAHSPSSARLTTPFPHSHLGSTSASSSSSRRRRSCPLARPSSSPTSCRRVPTSYREGCVRRTPRSTTERSPTCRSRPTRRGGRPAEAGRAGVVREAGCGARGAAAAG